MRNDSMLWLFVRTAIIWAIGILIASSAALAQDSKNLVVGGVRGRWFPLPTAGMLLDEHLQVPVLKQLVAEQEALVKAREAQIAGIQLQMQTFREASYVAQAVSVESKRALRAADISIRAADNEIVLLNAKLKAWYRRPILWLGLGVVLGGTGLWLIQAQVK